MGENKLNIAVLSGKGGTGKTFVSVNLAYAAGESTYLDCDVEEPNGYLFFDPAAEQKETVTANIPALQPEICTGCRTCVEFCKFNAIAFVGGKPMIFEDICHSCGGCMMLCPASALKKSTKNIGSIYKGKAGKVDVITGALKTGEPSGTAVIREVLAHKAEGINIIDCPPGSACTVMESIKEADYCVIVTEPTAFGVHNLAMVHELVMLFKKPFGVVINKYFELDNNAQEYCAENNIKVLCSIPYSRELAELNSNAHIAARISEYKEIFDFMLQDIKKEAGCEETADN